MKDIRIKRLALENFKCHKSLVLDFNGGNASIYGDNASGKTSIYDALTWLLFGKDSRGNGEKNIEIKPLNKSGEVNDRLAITAVEAVLIVDGEEITLRRTLKEVWTTKRGSVEPTYDGNTSEYYIDGVPCKKFMFSEKVDDLVDEDTFRLLTSVSHFADGISWQERRAVLFRVAGVMDDEQILATDERFEPLIKSMGKLSLDDYKKKLAADKRGFVGAKTEIPARISECQKTVEDVSEIDFDKARRELEILNAKRAELESQILAIEHDTALDNKRVEIREAKLELEKLNAENRAYRASQTANAPDVEGMKKNIARLLMTLDSKRKMLAATKSNIPECEKNIAECRARWIAVNGETFTGGSCPTCGQTLPTAQLKEATAVFETEKARRLHEIEQTANARKEFKAREEARIVELEAEVAQLEKECDEAQSRIKVAESYIVTPVDMEGYAERKAVIEGRIYILERELADMSMNSLALKSGLQNKAVVIKLEADKQRDILAKETLLEYSRRRIEELQEDARNAAACLDAIEGMLYLIDEYARYKTQFVEDSINGMFRIAHFRLFREQANGGVEDRCDVVYEGVPYINVNNGAKINVGIDIINTLSRSYGVTVPLFVDNAESITKLEESEGQVIRLAVSEKDKELRVEYEN